MRTITWLSLVLMPLLAGAQTPESILDAVREKQLERWDGLQSYSVTRSVSGMSSTVIYQRSEVQTEGGMRTVFTPVTASIKGTGGDDISSGPFGNDAGAALAELQAMEDFIQSAELVGTETIDGRNAFHLRVEDAEALDIQAADNFTMDVANLWVDANEYVPLRMTMTGVMREGGQERDVSIERVQTDYREVPGTKLYESYRQTMAMNGTMSDEDRAKLEQAKVELEKFEQEMASMPAQQRQMIEKMMGPRMEMMRQMVEGSGITIDVVVSEIAVNPL